VDLGFLAGSFGLFFTLFLLFCRYLPVIAMAEVKTVMPAAHPHGHGESESDAVMRADYQPDEHHRHGGQKH
jgi:molybdopterin-containing oxidoreductase family membrane subunit